MANSGRQKVKFIGKRRGCLDCIIETHNFISDGRDCSSRVNHPIDGVERGPIIISNAQINKRFVS